MLRRSIFISLVVAFIAGCATATGPEFSQLQPNSTTEGNLYVYRKPALYAVGATYDVLDSNKKVIAGLVSGSYVVLSLKPGKHSFSVSEGFGNPRIFEVQVEAGKNYFVEYDSSKGILLGWGILTDVASRANEQGLVDLKGLKRNN